jgi:hypothetical protein
MLVTKHSTPAGLGQLFDLWVIKASNAKDTPEGVIRWNVEDAGTNSACYQAMDEIAPHNHIAKPGDTLDVAQTHVGAEIGAQVTISHYRRGDNCGNAVTIIASANKAQAA